MEHSFFETIEQEITKNVKGVHVSTLSKSDVYNVKDDEWISTPSLDLNRILSGSLHRGITTRSLVGIVGPEMSMKSSFLALCFADAMKKGFIPVLIDTERGATSTFCERWGIDPSKIKIIYAPYIENVAAILAQLLDLARKHKKEKFIVGLDSLGALDTDRYFTGALKDDVKSDMGGIARSTKALLKLFLNFCIETNSVGLCTGHMYSRPGAVPLPDAVSHGKAFKLFPNVLISMKKENMKTGDKEIVGNIITATTLKNRITPPFQQATVSLHYELGLDPYAGLFDFMYNESGHVIKEGNTYSIKETGEKLGIGEVNASKKIKDHPELLEKLEAWLAVNKRYSQIKEIKDAYESGSEDVVYETVTLNNVITEIIEDTYESDSVDVIVKEIVKDVDVQMTHYENPQEKSIVKMGDKTRYKLDRTKKKLNLVDKKR
jgi:recombination protein RecA